jgi:hypothetical protein
MSEEIGYTRDQLEALRLEYLQYRETQKFEEAEETALYAHQLANSVGERTPRWAIRDAVFLTDMKRLMIKEYARRFCRTRNPMYAWEAFLAARSIGSPPPEWVLKYLEEGASSFWRSWQRGHQGSHPEEVFAEAFGIRAPRSEKNQGRSGRGTIWTRYDADRQRVRIGRDVAMFMGRLSKGGKLVKTAVAVEAAMQDYNSLHTSSPISFWQTLRSWKYYRRAFSKEASLIIMEHSR